MTTLAQVAASLVETGRGILAADESVATMSKRLEEAGVTPSPEARRDYRELLITTPGLASWVSGVILCDETLRQSFRDGTPVPAATAALGIQPGIKVDTGTSPLAFSEHEVITEGLDKLRPRLEEYRGMGATFAKWRAVIYPGRASRRAIHANAHALARYAALCQEQGVVPIVEPEVLMDGDHSIAECASTTSATLAEVFAELELAGVDFEAMVLKPNMVIAGSGHQPPDSPQTVAARTLDVLTSCLPSALPGVAFLSGGQSNATACANLAAINQEARRRSGASWKLTYSFGRALVSDALHAWKGSEANFEAGQKALAANCERASQASMGNDLEGALHA